MKWYSLAFSLLCILSIIDYLGIYDIVGFNESLAEFTDVESTGVAITDISGPYRQRSQFSANLSICFPISLYYVGIKNKDRWIWGIMFLILVGTTILTFSRMIYVSLTFSILFYLWYRVLDFKFLAWLFILGLIISFSISAQVRNSIYIGSKFLGSRFLEVEKGHAGDTWRYDALIITLEDLKSKPLGMGFNRIWSPKMKRYANPHSLYTSYFRAGGFIAIITFLLILYQTMKTIKLRHQIPEVIPLICCIFSMMIYAITHLASSIIFWCFIGILFSLKTGVKWKKSHY